MSLSILTYIYAAYFRQRKVFRRNQRLRRRIGQTHKHTQKLKLVEQQESPNESRFIYSRILTRVYIQTQSIHQLSLHKTGDQKQTSNVFKKTCLNYLYHQIANWSVFNLWF